MGKKKIIRNSIIFIIVVLILIIGIIAIQKAGVIEIAKNKIEELKQAQIEEQIQSIIDETKQEVMENEGREATISDLKEKLRGKGYELNKATGEVKYNEYYVTINSDLTIASIEEIKTKTECQIIEANEQNIETLITIENINGIEKITTEDITLECKGKNKVALDRTLENGKLYPISVKIKGKDKEEQYSVIAEKRPTVVIANNDTTGDGTTKTVKIESGNEEFLTRYYSLDDGETWHEYTEELNILEEDNKTIAAKTEVKQEKVKGNLVLVKTGEEISLIVSDGLVSATQNAIMKNDTNYRIAVKDEEYRVHTYIENEDILLETNRTYGNVEHIGKANENAKYMVIVKVNGNLTIKNGVTLTAYGNNYGGPKGMLVYATGNIENNGTITMTARGAKAQGQNVYLWKNKLEQNSYEFVPKVGGTGGNSVEKSSGVKGTNGVNRQTGRRRLWRS